MFKIFTLLIFTSLLSWGCPFDEAKTEVTIVAYKTIVNAVKEDDFEKASKEIQKQKVLYTYFENAAKEPLYQELLDAAKSKDAQKVKKLLDRSLILEIEELLAQVDTSFTHYKKSRLLLIKAKKHLKALTKKRKPMKYMKKILKSIGNPGLMGVGKREPNKAQFLKNKKLLLTNISAK